MARRAVTKESVLEALDEIAAKHPGPAAANEMNDMFNGDGSPRDLVGRIMHSHGYKPSDFVVTVNGETIRQCSIRAIKLPPWISDAPPVNLQALLLLTELELLNDEGVSWAEIYSLAKEAYE